jgi:hypothetical protein
MLGWSNDPRTVHYLPDATSVQNFDLMNSSVRCSGHSNGKQGSVAPGTASLPGPQRISFARILSVLGEECNLYER